MANIGDLTARLTLNTAGFQKGVEQANGLAGGLKKAISGVVKGTAVAVGAASVAVTAFVKSAVNSYANYEQLVGGVDTLFKDSSQLVQNYASSAFERAGVSANTYMEQVTSFSASLLQSLGGDTEKAAKSADQAIVDMSDNANKMGTPIERIQDAYQGFAKGQYQLLDNLKLGYGGTKTEMERLLKDAEKISGVKYDISNLNDVYSAIHVIQTELGITGTTAEEASTTLSGSLNMVKASWQNLLTAVVRGGVPLTEAIDDFVWSAKTMVKNFAPAIKSALSGVAQLISELAPVILAEIPSLIETLLPEFVNAVKSILTGIINALPALLETLKNAAPLVKNAIADLVPSIVSFILESVPQLVETGVTLLEALGQGLLESIGIILPKVTEFIQKLTDQIKSSTDENKEGFTATGLKMLTSLVSGLADSILTVAPDLVKAVADLVAELAKSVGQNTTALANVAIEIIKHIVDSLAPSIPSLMADITNAVMAIITAIIDVITGLDVNTFLNACVTIVTALADGITESIYVITDALPELITGIVVWLTNPENLANLATAAVTVFGSLVSNIAEITGALIIGLAEIVKAIADYFIEHQEEIRESFISAFTTLGDYIETIWEDQIKPSFETLGTNLRQYFSQFEWGATFLAWAQSVRKGITEKIDFIKTAFTGENGLVAKIKKWASEFDLKSVGSNIVNSIKDGIMQAIDNAREAIKSVLRSLLPDWAWQYIDGGGEGQPFDANLTTGQVVPREHRAGGGSVYRNSPYIVGEEGAELFVPNSNGYIVPHDELDFGQKITVNVGDVYGESYLRDYVLDAIETTVRREVRLGA